MKPIDITPTDHRDMVAAYANESDRGAAVHAGSFIEAVLVKFLVSCGIDKSDIDKKDFNERIVLADKSGLLSQEVCSRLHVIRKIRNHFAHHPKVVSFSESPIRELVATLPSLSPSEKAFLAIEKTLYVDDGRISYLVAAEMFMIIANNKIYGYGNPKV